MAVLHALLLASVAVFVVSILGSAAAAGVRGLRLWRTFRGFQRNLELALADATRRLDEVEPRLAGASTRATELERSLARLQSGLKEATTLLRAVTEAWSLVGRALAFLPSK